MKHAALLLALTVVLAGCGGDADEEPRAGSSGSPSPTTSAPTSPSGARPGAAQDPIGGLTDGSPGQRALRSAVLAYSGAFLTGDADESYALLSRRCRRAAPFGQWEQLLEMAAQRYGEALPVLEYEALISGDRAQVTYSYADASIDQTDERWVREGDSWHNDDC